MSNEFKDKRILVTGGTGSVGSAIVRNLLQYEPRQIRVLSRDESKQYNLFHELKGDPRVRLLVGDVRDKERVDYAMENVNLVFHAAAMKHVVSCENDPYEAVKTNVIGTQNVIECALKNKVDKIIGISTDKATDPVSVMGCTKLLAERIMLASFFYKGDKKTKACFVRFGNVLSTRGSVVPTFYNQIKQGGPLTVTDESMVRFFMSVDEAINLVLKAAAMMDDREIFVLKMPVFRIVDLAQAVIELYGPELGRNPKDVEIKIIGRKNGERIHEKLLSKDEATYAFETDDMFIITPVIGMDSNPRDFSAFKNARPAASKEYGTEGLPFLSVEEIKQKLVQDDASLRRLV